MTHRRLGDIAHWLMKSELDVYPWSSLVSDGFTHWDGVRNYQARNLMRDQMTLGDLILFYHSNCKPPHVAGVARVRREAYPDHTSWDPTSKYHDPKSTPEAPRWFMVDIEPVLRFPEIVALPELRADPRLEGMPLLARFQRLSVQPVEDAHFDHICRLGGVDPSTLNGRVAS